MIRIVAASVLSVVLVAGAYAISGPFSFLASKTAHAQSTDELLKAYAAKDSDADGLPDWQEALYGTDPNNPHSVDPALTDSQAVAKGLVTPKTSAAVPTQAVQTEKTGATSADIPGADPTPGGLTDQFGREFFQDFVTASNGQQLTPDQQQALITQLITSYSQKAARLLGSQYTSVSLRVSPSTSVSEYAGAVENIIRVHDVPADSSQPIVLLQAYVEKNDTSVLPKLVLLGNSYAAITKDLVATPVPPSLAAQHLALIQSFDTLARATKAAANYTTDPLAVMGSLTVLPGAGQGVLDAFSRIAQVIVLTGEPSGNEPGAVIVNIARTLQTK